MKTVKDLKIKDKKKLAEFSEADVKKELQAARKMLFTLEMKNETNELKQTHLVRFARRYVAQLLTIASAKGFKVS